MSLFNKTRRNKLRSTVNNLYEVDNELVQIIPLGITEVSNLTPDTLIAYLNDNGCWVFGKYLKTSISSDLGLTYAFWQVNSRAAANFKDPFQPGRKYTTKEIFKVIRVPTRDSYDID